MSPFFIYSTIHTPDIAITHIRFHPNVMAIILYYHCSHKHYLHPFKASISSFPYYFYSTRAICHFC